MRFVLEILVKRTKDVCFKSTVFVPASNSVLNGGTQHSTSAFVCNIQQLNGLSMASVRYLQLKLGVILALRACLKTSTFLRLW